MDIISIIHSYSISYYKLGLSPLFNQKVKRSVSDLINFMDNADSFLSTHIGVSAKLMMVYGFILGYTIQHLYIFFGFGNYLL